MKGEQERDKEESYLIQVFSSSTATVLRPECNLFWKAETHHYMHMFSSTPK